VPVVAPSSATMPAVSAQLELLSPRERELAALIARGDTSQDIVTALAITQRTADAQATHIRDKLGLRSRAEIAAWAIRHGLG
jgi:DNA-binding CsgD family transcriptional regulator